MRQRGIVVALIFLFAITSVSAAGITDLFKIGPITGKVIAAQGSYHSADTNHDWKISLTELTRVIELYNYRVYVPEQEGYMRTGEYSVNSSNLEDGYQAGPGSRNGQFHSVDTNQNWNIEGAELSRLTAIYNARAGTTRTGEYTAYGDTVDGFIPVNRKPLTCGILGDLDNDLNITTLDYYLVGDMAAGLRTHDLTRADVNGDGQITVSDWTLHGRYMEGLNNTFPACSSSSNLNCVARIINGYSVPALINGESRLVNQTTTVPNGVRFAYTTFTCTNGVVQAGAETANLRCNAGYNSIGTQCVLNSTGASCTDSDGGLNYNVKGKITYNQTAEASDACANSQELMEMYCANNEPRLNITLCSNGCLDGACKINNYTANICERYQLEVSDITDTDPTKNSTRILSRFDYTMDKELDINEIEYIGNIAIQLISANEQEDTATIILLSGTFESVTYDKYHNNGTTVKLSGSSLTFDRDTMDYFTISLGCSSANATLCAGYRSNMDACLNSASCGFDQRTNSCVFYSPGPASCVDPDGGNKPEVQAHTFGYRAQYASDRDKRILTGGLDACLSNSQLNEHYCDSSGYITTTIINCVTSCNNGACVANSSTLDRPRYIIPSDIGIFSYKKDSLEYGKYADMVDYIAAEFSEKEFIDGESAKLAILETTEYDRDAAIAMAVFEKDFTLADIKQSEIIVKIANKIKDGGNAELEYNDVGETLGQGKNGKMLVWARDEYGIIAIWVSNGKFFFFTAEDHRAIGSDKNLVQFLATYLNKYPSTLTEGDISIECTDGCSYNGRCIPIGTRTNDGKFCSYNGVLGTQLESGGFCSNNFECGSNVCINSQCVDAGLIDRILNWFKRIFGGNNPPKNEFPSTIGDYKRVDSVRTETDCVDLNEDTPDNVYNLTGKFCATTKRSQYERTTADDRTGVFVSIWDITEGNDLFEKYMALAAQNATVRAGGKTYTILRLENHELLWFTAQEDPLVVFTQEYNATRDNDGTSYSYGWATGNNDVTRHYIDNFPPVAG